MKIVNGVRYLSAELTESQWQYIRTQLGRLPHDEVSNLVNALVGQLSEQLTVPSAPGEPPKGLKSEPAGPRPRNNSMAARAARVHNELSR